MTPDIFCVSAPNYAHFTGCIAVALQLLCGCAQGFQLFTSMEPGQADVRWLVRSDHHLLVFLGGQDFTVAKFLQEELLTIPAVSFASCDVQPDGVTLCVRTCGYPAQGAVVEALATMRAKCGRLSELCCRHVSGYADTPGFRNRL